MSDAKNPGSYKIDVPDSALQEALAAVEARTRKTEITETPAPEGEIAVETEAGVSTEAAVTVELEPAAEAPAPEPAPAPAPPPPKRTPQDAIIEALIKGKQEALEALKQTQTEAKELLDGRARLQAEFENYKKRVFREKQEARADTMKNVARELLPVVDNFERAMAHLDIESASPEMKNLMQGIQLVSKQVLEVLKKFGITGYSALGQPFDPARHEAVAQQTAEGDQVPGTVIAEHQKGYLLNEVLLRPALVVVAGPKES